MYDTAKSIPDSNSVGGRPCPQPVPPDGSQATCGKPVRTEREIAPIGCACAAPCRSDQ